ncbi:MAG: hypothetical protein IJD57_03945 [Candidatus Gastranaerophilales bacterium]|nr:hypothetical protein [Candidatus Gastranaerophilales bacterium]
MKKIFLFLLFLIFSCNVSFASKLPNDVWAFIKKNLPSAQQRFDSVITLSNDEMYIPLTPPSIADVETIKIEYTYPNNKTLKDLPEVVLLNNGYSLLKVSKDKEGNYTLTKQDELPIKVRLGLMPQDMLTPVGLKMPDSLKLTLGDLLIPTKEETTLTFKKEEKEKIVNPYSPAIKRDEFILSAELKGKKALINSKNSKFLSVYDDTSKNPLYELKLSSMPLKIVTSEKSKVALVLYWSGKKLEIIDLKDERIVQQIEIGASATDVALDKKENLAYVASQNAKEIYVVDLSAMELKKIIKLDQRPSKIAYSEVDKSISFYDEYSSKVYNVTESGTEFIVQQVGEAQNVSQILSDVANIYAISRTKAELYVYDKVQAKLISTIMLDKKPTDAIRFKTKIYILCSQHGFLDVYDTVENKLISREQIAKEGFYSKMTLIPDEKSIMISGINTKDYILFDLETMKVTSVQESYVDVANIIFTDKEQKAQNDKL